MKLKNFYFTMHDRDYPGGQSDLKQSLSTDRTGALMCLATNETSTGMLAHDTSLAEAKHGKVRPCFQSLRNTFFIKGK